MSENVLVLCQLFENLVVVNRSLFYPERMGI